jgi:alpha-ketoglutarate-dependent taurine dioxygenase
MLVTESEPGHARSDGEFDNHPRNYQHITAIPLSSALGAEIRNLDLSAITDAQFLELEDALYHHKVVYLRDQHISHADQEQLTARFGEFGIDAFTDGMPEHQNVQKVVKEADQKLPMVFGGSWHTDSAFLQRPPAISLLYAVDAPPYGGDTWYANTAIAYEFLTPAMQAIINPMSIHMSGREVVAGYKRKRGRGHDLNAMTEKQELEDMMVRGHYHPLVRRHPRTGQRSLYVDQTYSVGIEGLAKKEARALIDFLFNHIVQPAFTCRVRWQSNTFTMWDNRATLHHAMNDYDGFRREMYRTIVAGELPHA